MAKTPIGINQSPPSNPTYYPFVTPDEIVDDIVDDFYLSISNSNCQYDYPLRVSWLHGFGVEPATAIGLPTPTHDHEVQVKDFSGNVVFDSTSGSYSITTVDYQRKSIQWTSGGAVCSLLFYSISELDVSSSFVPDSATLDPRVINVLPLRVNSLDVLGDSFSGGVTLSSGWNTDIWAEETVSEDLRNVTRIYFSARPGGGKGRVPGCDEVDLDLKTINGVGPDESGNINLDFGPCLRSQRPGETTLGSLPYKREFKLGGSLYDSELIDLINGVADEFLGPDAESIRDLVIGDRNAAARASMQIYQSCTPCVSCDDYLKVYEALRLISDQYYQMGDRIEVVRDLFQDIVDRWNAQKACREGDASKVMMYNAWQCKVKLGAAFNNFTSCCLEPVMIRLTVRRYDSNDSPVAIGIAFAYARESYKYGSETKYLEEPFVFSGTLPVVDVNFGQVDSGTVAKIRTLMQFPGCSAGEYAKVFMTAHSPILLDTNGEPCFVDRTLEVPNEIRTLWPATPGLDPVVSFNESTVTMEDGGGYCH